MTRTPKLLGFYGDDFTGSTDAMEALTLNGISTILFLHTPTEEMLNEHFPDMQAFGIAGVSRSLSPEEMEIELKDVLKILKDSEAKICHYKTCSTFDSSPEIGSIGKAADIGKEIFGHESSFIPLVIGVPSLRRYTVFGNHFATVGDETYRLDHHPIMSKHPITPMKEANLIQHLKYQTDQSVALINMIDLSEDLNDIEKNVDEKKQNNDMILFDVLNKDNLEKIGKTLWREANKGQLFTIGSSGVEYALSAAWKNNEDVEIKQPSFKPCEPANPMLVVSGSCSIITKGQIEYALGNGFTGIQVSGMEFIDPDRTKKAREQVVNQATSLLSEGKHVIIYSALGPDDVNIEKVKKGLMASGRTSTDTGKILGEQFGEITKSILETQRLTRVVVAGGDTSGYVVKELEVFAMRMIMPITPGVPLCEAYSKNKKFNRLQLCLKGGQMGNEDFFEILQGELTQSFL